MPADVYRLKVSLPLEQARKIIAGALAKGRELALQPLTVVVLDAGGHVVAAEREDGSGNVRFEVARGKAGAALGIGIGSGTVGRATRGGTPFWRRWPPPPGARRCRSRGCAGAGRPGADHRCGGGER